jgi:hypothetical protein
MGDFSFTFQLFPFERYALDCIYPFRKSAKENFRGKLVEGRFGTFEKEFGEALSAQTPMDFYTEHSALVGILYLQSLPGVSIDFGVDTQVAVGVV